MQKGVRIAVTREGDSLRGSFVGPALLCVWPVERCLPAQAVIAVQTAFCWCAVVVMDAAEPGAPRKLAVNPYPKSPCVSIFQRF